MHAQCIIQGLLSTECPSMHAKRRACLAAHVEAASKGAVSLMGISRALGNSTTIRHRIKLSPQLDMLDAKAVVAIYSGRMQIEQRFRDVNNARWGLGLSTSQTRKPKRLSILLMIAALACYALWLIGLAAKSSSYRIEYGSRKKAGTALSIVSLARWWMMENQKVTLSRRQIDAALAWLRVMALGVKI